MKFNVITHFLLSVFQRGRPEKGGLIPFKFVEVIQDDNSLCFIKHILYAHSVVLSNVLNSV